MRADRVTNLATNQSLTTGGGFTTSPQQLNQAFGYSLAAVIKSPGAVSGILKLQTSVDGENWADILGSAQDVSDTGTIFYNATHVMYPTVRAAWADSGSDPAATMDVQFFYRSV